MAASAKESDVGRQFAIANNGSMGYISGQAAISRELALVLVDRAGVRKALNIPTGPYWAPRISPDGKQLAVNTDDKEQIVWIANLNDATPIRKLTFEGRNTRPLWTRDGQRVVFNSERGGERGIFWQRADGGVAERLAKLESGIQVEGVSQPVRDPLTAIFQGAPAGLVWRHAYTITAATVVRSATT